MRAKTIKSRKIKPPNTTIRKILSLLSNPYRMKIIPKKMLNVDMIKPYNIELNVIDSNHPR